MTELVYNGIYFTGLEFNKGINLIRGDSGVGKTFLFNVVSQYCSVNNISVVVLTKDLVKVFKESGIPNVDYIIADRADLYMDSWLWGKLKNSDSKCLLSMHVTYGYSTDGISIFTVRRQFMKRILRRIR